MARNYVHIDENGAKLEYVLDLPRGCTSEQAIVAHAASLREVIVKDVTPWWVGENGKRSPFQLPGYVRSRDKVKGSEKISGFAAACEIASKLGVAPPKPLVPAPSTTPVHPTSEPRQEVQEALAKSNGKAKSKQPA